MTLTILEGSTFCICDENGDLEGATNGLFAADRALVVTEPAAWASDGVDQVVRTIARVGDRRGRPLPLAGIVVNRLGRTRVDVSY